MATDSSRRKPSPEDMVEKLLQNPAEASQGYYTAGQHVEHGNEQQLPQQPIAQGFYPTGAEYGAEYDQNYYYTQEYAEGNVHAGIEGQVNGANVEQEWIDYLNLMKLSGQDGGIQPVGGLHYPLQTDDGTGQAVYTGAGSNDAAAQLYAQNFGAPQGNVPPDFMRQMQFMQSAGQPYPGHEQVYSQQPQAGFPYDQMYQTQQHYDRDGRPVYGEPQQRELEHYEALDQHGQQMAGLDQEWDSYVKLMNLAGHNEQMQQQFMQAAHGMSQLSILEGPHAAKGQQQLPKGGPPQPRQKSWADVLATPAVAKPHPQVAPQQQLAATQHHPPRQQRVQSSFPQRGGGRGGRTQDFRQSARSQGGYQATYGRKPGDQHVQSARPSSPPGPEYLNMVEVNPSAFDTNPKFARFFVIKSYSEDDVHKCIKYNIWASTDSGNRRLDAAFRESSSQGPIYLFFSVNASGQFCGMAQMTTGVDFSKKATVWAQDKWSGQFAVKWIFIKDIPNSQFRSIILTNNENKPVTNSRDTQEVFLEPGKEMLRIFVNYVPKTSILDDFKFYDERQKQKEGKRPGSLGEGPTEPAASTGDAAASKGAAAKPIAETRKTNGSTSPGPAANQSTSADATSPLSSSPTGGSPSRKASNRVGRGGGRGSSSGRATTPNSTGSTGVQA